jgi:hypothetical protein
MKNSIWDILTGIILLAILCLIAGFGAVVLNPNLMPMVGLGQNLSGQLVPTIALPTEVPPDELPSTWTPVPQPTTIEVNNDTMPTLRPSSTPLPTNTPIILPTFTATTKSSSSGSTGGSGGTGGTGAGVSGGGCTIVYQNPSDETEKERGEDFSTRWTLKNTSSTTWRSDSVDVRVASGTRMHTGPDIYDLSSSTAQNGMVDIIIPMEAPDTKGIYTENWALMQGNTFLCRFYVTIQVK